MDTSICLKCLCWIFMILTDIYQLRKHLIYKVNAQLNLLMMVAIYNFQFPVFNFVSTSVSVYFGDDLTNTFLIIVILWNWLLVKCEFEGIMFLNFSSKIIKLELLVNGDPCGFWGPWNDKMHVFQNDEMHVFQGVFFSKKQRTVPSLMSWMSDKMFELETVVKVLIFLLLM